MTPPRGATLTILLLAAFASSACSKTFDAYFVNPCDEAIVVQTHDSGLPASRVNETATLEPQSVTKVESAFLSNGGMGWSVTIEGAETVVRLNEETWVHETVVIPAEVCEEV